MLASCGGSRRFQPHISGEIRKRIREKRAYYEAHPELVDEIIADGCDKARKTARVTMESVRQAVKI